MGSLDIDCLILKQINIFYNYHMMLCLKGLASYALKGA